MSKSKMIHRTVSGLFLILLLAGAALAQKKNQVNPWFFIQLTDPQFGMFDSNAGFEKETALYEKAVAEINRLNPDFVVITGDFVNDQNSAAQISEFKRITAKIKPSIPVYYSPGNHDIGQVPTNESLEKYKKNYGSDRFSFRHKGSSFIGFNTGLIKSKLEKPEQAQFSWLTKKLQQSQRSQHIILFTHYPFFNKTADEPEAYSNIGTDYRVKYLGLFEKNGVEAVFSGHHHNNGFATYGNIQMVTTSALGKPLGKAPSGFRIIKVYNDKIEHEFFGLDELPDSVVFH
ncbi:MAG TPA: metallophosphatase [Prolixibacteraceae bacterium]|nr:metallophosphatase [Prolixibacteraceae bacterium]